MQFGARGLLIALLFSIAAAGCTSNDTEGTSEEEWAANAEIMAADTVWAEASMEGLTWDVPGSFQPVVPSTSMRIAQYELPAHTVGFGVKGAVTWSPTPVRTYRDYKRTDFAAAELSWLWGVNRGILTPPGLDEQWLVSLAHTSEDMGLLVGAFAELAEALRS